MQVKGRRSGQFGPFPKITNWDDVDKPTVREDSIIGRKAITPSLTHKTDRIDITGTRGMQDNRQSQNTMWDSDGVANEQEGFSDLLRQ